ncbi:BatD family protein [Parasalinivibrio latis]|uniref:BatD family protein n=1 Tax=Parasalinivibrio latis TaxID=2952610 RepID=UPI0030E17CDD
MKHQRFSLITLSKQARAILLVAVAAIASLPGLALAAEAIATVSKNVVGVNDPFQLTISVDESVDNDALDLSPLGKDFNYGRPNVSSSTSIINGSMTRSTEWRVALAAKQIGTFTIPSFDVDGMRTAPITIKVLKSSQRGNQADNQAVEVKAKLDRQSGYIGETFNYRVQLLIGTRIESPTLRAPYGNGLEVAQVGDDVQAETVLNGRRYIVVSREYQITPTKAGELTLNGAVFTGTQVKGNGWGPSLGVPVSRQAKTLTLSVKDKPASYTGLWLPTPNLQLEQKWEPATLSQKLSAKVGEPINRIITLKIKNIAQSAMPNLSLDYPATVRVYSDKPEYSEDGDYTVMTVKQVIIPREEGTVVLPAMSISWFNTKTGKQQTTSINGLTLDIKPGENSAASQPLMPQQTLVQPNEAPGSAQTVKVVNAGYWPWATGAFALLWLGTLVMYVRKPKVAPAAATSSQSGYVDGSAGALLAMEAAVVANDAVRVAAQYRNWDKAHLPDDLCQAIESEVNAMMASRYSTGSAEWNNSQLLSLLKKAAKVKKGKKTGETLSQL